MALKSEDVEIDGVVYRVTELNVAQALPIMEMQGSNLGVEMAKASVSVNGAPIGDAIMDMGFSAFRELMIVVNEVNGLAEDDEEGNG